MKNDANITFGELRRVLNYCPVTGIFTWTNEATRFRGQVAGSRRGGRYWRIEIAGIGFSAHRLAWLHSYGRWPLAEIDHINGDTFDNRLCNLREATRSQNQANIGVNSRNRSGFKGVYRRADDMAWIAIIRVAGRNRYLGSFVDPQDASAAFERESARVYGEFSKVTKPVHDQQGVQPNS